ncbi:23S rRNA (guanosine(2251)-2'-O)-methyltransferase RlmB [Brachyspira pilosicoli]|uniref:23S rRNA (Guanosine(2251)-2'-O)-methyltransferase RlmB n=1 Tax=Brachyspira pilosicoli TaxID=52584 RepID=A0AAJ6GHB8_BRAPL|nr:23S rRNA (guanosine(2251)-2'-O)-methyltransferase RlmB [Brachyspira pilosicoli]WIH90515.1 23S rRNA (guanosine(2251)-2'-O)-methyltransferase RlmB [Brachyspira pilosicoli]WIH92806.1 23S rRNA (guanosine(2251)-2'-O)-methyltransferase RlmB [Brachyspira pilosicoli]WIH95095.1 23S rRNA (guanosine(2251)-2'-O)-methyltransferase RlmB [Brachyspira pilosicoli]
MFISSKNAIVEALSKDLVDVIYIKFPISKREKEIIKLAERKKVLIKNVDKREMESIVGKVYSIAASVKENAKIGIDVFLDRALEKTSTPLIFILDSITDVHNLGAIIRNAYFFDLGGIIIPKDNAAPINEKVYEISAGAAYHLPISIETNLNRVIEIMKDKGFWVYYASEKGDTSLENFKFDTPTAIILGNEHSGVRDSLKKNSDGSIIIRAQSDFDSLNVSAASAIISYAYSVYKR